MKTNYILFLTSVVAGLLVGPASTQAQVSLKSISVGASYYKPSLDYWNQRSGLVDYNKGQGATFSGSVMPTAAIEVGLVKGLSVGGRIGYWKRSVAGDVTVGGTTRSEKLTLSIIPVSLDFKYTFAKTPTPTTEKAADGTTVTVTPKAPFLTPYIGVSVARYFINDDFTRQVSGTTGSLSESQAGNNYGIQFLVGAEKKLVKLLYLALDVRYHLGSYNQAVRTSTETTSPSTTEKVSLNGIDAGLSLRLKFK